MIAWLEKWVYYTFNITQFFVCSFVCFLSVAFFPNLELCRKSMSMQYKPLMVHTEKMFGEARNNIFQDINVQTLFPRLAVFESVKIKK